MFSCRFRFQFFLFSFLKIPQQYPSYIHPCSAPQRIGCTVNGPSFSPWTWRTSTPNGVSLCHPFPVRFLSVSITRPIGVQKNRIWELKKVLPAIHWRALLSAGNLPEKQYDESTGCFLPDSEEGVKPNTVQTISPCRSIAWVEVNLFIPVVLLVSRGNISWWQE